MHNCVFHLQERGERTKMAGSIRNCNASRFLTTLSPPLSTSTQRKRSSSLRNRRIVRSSPLYVLPSWVPQSRLVGIELNPGPPKGILKALTALALIPEVVKSQQPPKSSKRNKSKTASRNRYGTRPVRKLVVSPGSSKSVQAPVAVGSVSINRSISTLISIPFSGVGCQLTYAGSDVSNFAPHFSFDNSYFMLDGLPLNPVQIHAAAIPICGLAIAEMCDLYTNYRFESLKMEFVPIFSTGWNGNIAFGITPDSYDIKPTSAMAVMSAGINFMTPIWQKATVDLSSIVGKNSRLPWFINKLVPNGATPADYQQNSTGSVQAYCSGLQKLPVGTVLGFLHFSGVISLHGLARRDLIGNVDSKQVLTLAEIKELDRETTTTAPSHQSSSSPVTFHSTPLSVNVEGVSPSPNPDRKSVV